MLFYSAHDLPPGLTLSQYGELTGIPTAQGNYTFTVVAADVVGNSGQITYTLNVAEPLGNVRFIVKSNADGVFNFTSPEPALNASIQSLSGSGQSGLLSVKAGTYPVSFTVPDGFGVSSATCDAAGSTLDAATHRGTLSVASSQNITCTIVVLNARAEATQDIGNLFTAEANLILANEPDLGRRISRLDGTAPAGNGGLNLAGFFFASPLPMGFSLNDRAFGFHYDGAGQRQISDSPGMGGTGSDGKLDFWAEGASSRVDLQGEKGTFSIVHVGGDYLAAKNILFGVGLQGDWTHIKTGSGHVSGAGFMVGPYVTARLRSRLYVDGRLAVGTAKTVVAPFDTYEDHVDSTRSLTSVGIIGDYNVGRLTIRPEGRLHYIRFRSNAYIDGLGVSVPSVTVSVGQFTVGPEISWKVRAPEDWTMSPSLKLSGIWTFD
jgi:outer membrane autotransporter protein